MNAHSCFDCKFRKLPLKDTACDKGVVEKGGLVIQCLGWRRRKPEEDILDWIEDEIRKQYDEERIQIAETMVNEGIWTKAEASNWLITGYTFIKSYGVRNEIGDTIYD